MLSKSSNTRFIHSVRGSEGVIAPNIVLKVRPDQTITYVGFIPITGDYLWYKNFSFSYSRLKAWPKREKKQQFTSFWYLQKHVEYFDVLWPWPSLMICFVTFSWRISTTESTFGGPLASRGGSPCTNAVFSVTISSSPAKHMTYKVGIKN